MIQIETEGYQTIKKISLRFVRTMKVGDKPGIYRKEAGDPPGLYGSYHAAHILDLFGELEKFSDDEIESWADFFHQKQTKQGYYSNRPEDYLIERKMNELDPVWHATRGILWTLRKLHCKPTMNLTFLEPFLNANSLYKWVKSYDWSNPWASGNQILAAATALFALRDWFGVSCVDEVLETGMYPALEELLDVKTGYWGTQFGSDLAGGLFGTIHITPIYFSQGWPLRALERNVDSTLSLQYADGSFWPGGSDCPDFDGAYMIANLAALTNYRREDLVTAARKYIQHALMHQDPEGVGWLLHRRDSKPEDWRPRPHFIWVEGENKPRVELRDDDPDRTHIMLGSWFYPLSLALVSNMLGDTGFEGPYKLNRMSLHECNVFVT